MQKISHVDGKEWPVKSYNFLSLIRHISGIKQDRFQFHCFDIQEVAFFQTTGLYIGSPFNINIDFICLEITFCGKDVHVLSVRSVRSYHNFSKYSKTNIKCLFVRAATTIRE